MKDTHKFLNVKDSLKGVKMEKTDLLHMSKSKEIETYPSKMLQVNKSEELQSMKKMSKPYVKLVGKK